MKTLEEIQKEFDVHASKMGFYKSQYEALNIIISEAYEAGQRAGFEEFRQRLVGDTPTQDK